jgi:2-polyprenyl-6-methoxyphenol hydroxylase-like FAD-dependent oxidoreductase
MLLAGDAVHMHWPAGGLGLNVGLQDATNLGWRLAADVQGRAAPGLLDGYQTERHPVGTALAEYTLAQGALITATGPDGQALRAVLSELLAAYPPVESAPTATSGMRRTPRPRTWTQSVVAAIGSLEAAFPRSA